MWRVTAPPWMGAGVGGRKGVGGGRRRHRSCRSDPRLDRVGGLEIDTKGLFVNVGRSAGVFFANFPKLGSYPFDADRTTGNGRWQTHHHHQLCFL